MLSPIISIEKRGIQVKGIFLPRWLIFCISFVLVGGLGYLIFYLSKRQLGFKKGLKEIEEALVEIKKIEEREKEAQRLREKFEEEKKKLEERLKQH